MGRVAPSAAGPLLPPHPLRADHVLDGFECGEEALDTWLKRRALRNQGSGASRTYVVSSGGAVVGYHSLAVGSVIRDEAARPLQRNMPDVIPVMLLARLAVHSEHKGRGVGAALLQDAIRRTLQVSETAGVAALLAHAKHETAALFYERHGFRRSPVRPLTLMLALREMEAGLGGG